MIREEDFVALMRVFHGAVSEMVEKPTAIERMGVIKEWQELMGRVDNAMGVMITEKSVEERRNILKDFEKTLKEFGFIK